jgi:hypothetical protein
MREIGRMLPCKLRERPHSRNRKLQPTRERGRWRQHLHRSKAIDASRSLAHSAADFCGPDRAAGGRYSVAIHDRRMGGCAARGQERGDAAQKVERVLGSSACWLRPHVRHLALHLAGIRAEPARPLQWATVDTQCSPLRPPGIMRLALGPESSMCTTSGLPPTMMGVLAISSG